MSNGVELARTAVERRDWLAAYTAYSAVDPTTLVEPDDVAALGDAAWWCGHLGEAIALRERAFGEYLAVGVTSCWMPRRKRPRFMPCPQSGQVRFRGSEHPDAIPW